MVPSLCIKIAEAVLIFRIHVEDVSVPAEVATDDDGRGARATAATEGQPRRLWSPREPQRIELLQHSRFSAAVRCSSEETRRSMEERMSNNPDRRPPSLASRPEERSRREWSIYTRLFRERTSCLTWFGIPFLSGLVGVCSDEGCSCKRTKCLLVRFLTYQIGHIRNQKLTYGKNFLPLLFRYKELLFFVDFRVKRI